MLSDGTADGGIDLTGECCASCGGQQAGTEDGPSCEQTFNCDSLGSVCFA